LQPTEHQTPDHGQAPARTVAPERRRWLTGTSLPLVAAIAGVLALAAWPRQDTPASVDLTALVAAQPAESATATNTDEDFPENIEYTVQRNDTLDQIFRSVGIDLSALVELRSRPEVRRTLDIVRPGDIITLTHIDGVLQSLNRQISNTLTLSVARSGDGFAVNYVENPLETEIVGRRATINSSLFAAGKESGMSAETIMTLANQMFGWDIDFALDIRAGDEFSVLYEQKFQDGEYVNDGRVLAAEFVNQGKTHRAVWFQSLDGEVQGYFTPEGKGMRKAFLRAPLDFTRVSSVFNPRRVHPISGRVRAHKGVDYAAPTGTPIWAAGDGRVEFAGRKGGYGNVVMIDHGKGISTVYGHMSRFGKLARVGTRVKQGAIIGYVGMTGAATGPHLHYEYRVKGVHKNPATIPMPRTEIPGSYLAEFQRQSASAMARLELTSGHGAVAQLASR
jgi:murein DD-endopeptidase MepM/ murein hydrolase activator NlpD